jgi:hypothetical protein
MGNIVSGQTIGKEVCAALNLDVNKVVSIDIHIAVDDAVTVDVTQLVFQEEINDFFAELTKYELTPKQ